jgi:hypothetical protein
MTNKWIVVFRLWLRFVATVSPPSPTETSVHITQPLQDYTASQTTGPHFHCRGNLKYKVTDLGETENNNMATVRNILVHPIIVLWDVIMYLIITCDIKTQCPIFQIPTVHHFFASERDHFEDFGVHGRMTLNWILNRIWGFYTGVIWLSIRSSGGLLWTRQWTSRFHHFLTLFRSARSYEMSLCFGVILRSLFTDGVYLRDLRSLNILGKHLGRREDKRITLRWILGGKVVRMWCGHSLTGSGCVQWRALVSELRALLHA